MRIAILAPGPSLLETYPGREGFDVVITINRAGRAFPGDYWVALDAYTLNMMGVPRGGPAIVTSRSQYGQMRRLDSSLAELPHIETEAIEFDAADVKWRKFSATVALALAAELGATHIECFGMDRTGAADFDGFTHTKQNRRPDRWREEAKVWDAMCAGLARGGVSVDRILSGHPAQSMKG